MYDSNQTPNNNYRPTLGQAVGQRGSIGQGINMPPPYRAPPHNMNNNNQQPPPPPKGSNLPYSRFNISEPNVAGQYKSSPIPGYRHTINHEQGSSVQTNLKQMLAMPKHNTLDMNSQNAALQHLRMQGLNPDGRSPQQPAPGQYQQRGGGGGQVPAGHHDPGQNTNGDSYNGPDSLRNTANKMFSRNNEQRGSGYNGQTPGQGYQNNYHYSHQQQQQGLNQSHHSLNQSLNQSMDTHNYDRGQGQPRMRQDSSEDPTKRNSYGNQSFRNAIQTPGQMGPPPKPGQGQKLPPQVPPKPGSRSASKERPRDSANDENDHLENELKNILRGNHNNKESFNRNNSAGTPPLPALSPSQSANHTPQSSPDFRAKKQKYLQN